MVTTGTGRKKFVIQDIMDAIDELVVLVHRDPIGAMEKHEWLKDQVLSAIQHGDFQGYSARLAAKYALEARRLAALKNKVP